MKKKVIVIFDIGKTNKKLLLFDNRLNIVYQKEEKFKTVIDEDGDECDDIDLIESWIHHSLSDLLTSNMFEPVAVNFSTCGASLVCIDEKGKRLTPVYNYLKQIPPAIQNDLFEKYGGKFEFCRKTASPALGCLLNSGIQILWIKEKKRDIFNRTSRILHFPQYLSFILTKTAVSESTSIGCHTFLWDFDNNSYHPWLKNENIALPEPIPNTHTFPIEVSGRKIYVGIGIHDSSASLVPYLKGSRNNFLLISTGTWCINMNPFNHSPLTEEQLKMDCLSFLDIKQKPVKSSRLFIGNIHDLYTDLLSDYFKVTQSSFKTLKTNESLLNTYLSVNKDHIFFKKGVPDSYIDKTNIIDLSVFSDFSEAYHHFMYDLVFLNKKSIDLILDDNNCVNSIYISGGFARNEIFVRLLASYYPDKTVYTSKIDNSSALGAALVIWDTVFMEHTAEINLGLKKWNTF